MATKKETITAEMIRQAYLAYSQRQPDPEAFVSFTEHELTAFIRQYFDAGFPGIYAQRDHNYYEKEIRGHIADTQERRDADMASGNKLSLHLKIYSHFLESKAFKSLARQSPASGSALPKTSTAQPASGETSPTSAGNAEQTAADISQATEGDSVRIEELEIVRRNPQLRQACIRKWGYQCQCCGMDFASLYGEELGKNFIEVHHLKPISTYKDRRPEDYVDNLVPLCSNCHSMIHRGKGGPLTLRQLREAYRGPKTPLRICKED